MCVYCESESLCCTGTGEREGGSLILKTERNGGGAWNKSDRSKSPRRVSKLNVQVQVE